MLIDPFAARLAVELKKRIEAYAPAQAARTAAETESASAGTSPESMIVVTNLKPRQLQGPGERLHDGDAEITTG